MRQMLWEYLLVYCTSHFLRTIGETPAPYHRDLDQAISSLHSCGWPVPVWIIFLFSLLCSLRFIVSFLVHYVFEVILTVVIVSSEPISPYAAACARAYTSLKPAPPAPSTKAVKVAFANGTAKGPDAKRQDSILQAKLRRIRTAKRSVQSWSTWFINLPCFRGLNAYLIMCISQWYLSVTIDFFLSGQPEGLQLGYGSSYVLVAICFGGSAALWTHCAITERSSDYVYNHFPKGRQILPKLFPVTTMWAFSEQIALSLPLALSRIWKLKQYAENPDVWSNLGPYGQSFVMVRFAIVFALHLAIVACAVIPANMILRRVHATMLDAEETALVPHHHAQKEISITEAWSTMDWDAYRRVLAIYVQRYFLGHAIHLVYWSAVWGLHYFCQTNRYDIHSLPNAPTNLQVHILAKG
ncbi:MAG: hypothetical protein LQ338_007878 [Usnochroma carphineum]|nr:MAG: hypothetical protein LQ338_007878 [Usnochroma carphineum]